MHMNLMQSWKWKSSFSVSQKNINQIWWNYRFLELYLFHYLLNSILLMMRTICNFIFDTVVICLLAKCEWWNGKHSRFRFHSIVINWIAHLCFYSSLFSICVDVKLSFRCMFCLFRYAKHHIKWMSFRWLGFVSGILDLHCFCYKRSIPICTQMNISLLYFNSDASSFLFGSVYFRMGWFEMLFMNDRYSTPEPIYK